MAAAVEVHADCHSSQLRKEAKIHTKTLQNFLQDRKKKIAFSTDSWFQLQVWIHPALNQLSGIKMCQIFYWFTWIPWFHFNMTDYLNIVADHLHPFDFCHHKSSQIGFLNMG